MASGWLDEKAWSDQFTPSIKRILAETFIMEAPPKEDQEQATDLMVFSVYPYTVACRVRHVRYIERFGYDVTIREARPSGALTELDKIIGGFGHYFFYGFGNPRTQSVDRWVILNLDHLRAQMIEVGIDSIRKSTLRNNDKSSSFIAIDVWEDLQPYCIHRHSPGYFNLKRYRRKCG